MPTAAKFARTGRGDDIPAPNWMSTRAAADRLGVTLRTLYRFIDRGGLPAYRMGRVIRLQAGDVDEYVDRLRVNHPALKDGACSGAIRCQSRLDGLVDQTKTSSRR